MIDEEEYKKWLDSRPPKVAAVIRKFPPLVCYRGRGRDFIDAKLAVSTADEHRKIRQSLPAV